MLSSTGPPDTLTRMTKRRETSTGKAGADESMGDSPMRVVKYSTHLYAIKNVADGSYVQEYSDDTGQLEVMVFSSPRTAQEWISNHRRPTKDR